MSDAAAGQRGSGAGGEASPRAGPILALWVALTMALQGILWGTGFKAVAVGEAVERGAARAESAGIGEVEEAVIRKAIDTQQATRPFWTTLALLGDFAVEPLALVLRAVAVAVLLSGVAALAGRPARFGLALSERAAAQGFWVLGLAVRAGLILALRRPEAETSLTLALPPGEHPAVVWVGLQQLDLFALLGWVVLARGGWRRGQAGPATAALICGSLWSLEAAVRITCTLIAGAGMRLTLIPEWATR